MFGRVSERERERERSITALWLTCDVCCHVFGTVAVGWGIVGGGHSWLCCAVLYCDVLYTAPLLHIPFLNLALCAAMYYVIILYMQAGRPPTGRCG